MGKKSREKRERGDSILGAVVPVIRQAMQPPVFRIVVPKPVTHRQIQEDLSKTARLAQAKPAPAQEVFPQEEWKPFLAKLGTGLWRLKQRMVDPGSDRPREEMKRAYRHFESIWDVLHEAGIHIKDHTGDLVPERGISQLNVSAYQPTPGLKREKVIDTIKPTIWIKPKSGGAEVLIQMGEVIVGTPEEQSRDVASPQDRNPPRV